MNDVPQDVSHDPQTLPTLDWHPADIVAALRKRGLSLRKLAVAHGFKPGSLSNCMRQPWPKAERIIADAIGLEPNQIWPTRYTTRRYQDTQAVPAPDRRASERREAQLRRASERRSAQLRRASERRSTQARPEILKESGEP